MEIKKSSPLVADIVKTAYPGYRGRRPVKIMPREKHRISDYWDGGSRTYAKFMHLPTQRLIGSEHINFEQQKISNPFNLPMGTVNLSREIAVIEKHIFRGKSMGITVVLHPETYTEWKQRYNG